MHRVDPNEKVDKDLEDWDNDALIDIYRSTHTEPSPTELPNREDTHFRSGNRLTAKDIYRATVGLFEDPSFSLVRVISKEADEVLPIWDTELARIYKRNSDNKLYVLYYPGKDNEKPYKLEDKTESLNAIFKRVNREIIANKICDKDELKAAKKLLLVGESNTYKSFSVAHWIKADLTNGVLTTEDSMNRNYDESGIRALCPDAVVNVIKRGWQMLWNKWKCGFFVIEAMRRDIYEMPTRRDLDITSKTTEEHFKLYLKGHTAIANKSADLTIISKKSGVEEVLHRMQAVNGYLKKRAKETSGFLSFFSNYSGKDYYSRRESWKKILEGMHQWVAGKETQENLVNYIKRVATRYKKQCSYRSDYHDQLRELANTLDAFDISTLDKKLKIKFKERIVAHAKMYNQMNRYAEATSKYLESSAHGATLKTARASYETHYQLLKKSDKKDFMSTEEEYFSERRNILRY
jgi:hypothetical protein